MPNWVQNNVKIDCDAETLKRIYEAVQYDPNTDTDELTGPGSIDFNKIVPRPNCLDIESGSNTVRGIELYLTMVNPATKDFGMSKMEAEKFHELCAALNSKRFFLTYNNNLADDELAKLIEDPDKEKIIELGSQAIFNLTHYGATSWYDWNISNWGTKWNSCYGEKTESGFSFQTAWSAPIPILEKLSEMYPDVQFSLEYADEDIGCNCGRVVFQGGAIEEEYHPEYGDEAIRFACSVWDSDPEEFLIDED